MTAIVAHRAHVAALGCRHAVALVPAVLVHAGLPVWPCIPFNVTAAVVTPAVIMPSAVVTTVIVACLCHRRSQKSCSKHKGNELFHRSLHVLFMRKTIGEVR